MKLSMLAKDGASLELKTPATDSKQTKTKILCIVNFLINDLICVKSDIN